MWISSMTGREECVQYVFRRLRGRHRAALTAVASSFIRGAGAIRIVARRWGNARRNSDQCAGRPVAAVGAAKVPRMHV